MATVHQAAHRPSPFLRGAALFLLLAGAAFYLSWGVLYGTWTDPGVYSVSAVLIGFGLTGYLLHTPTAEEEAQE